MLQVANPLDPSIFTAIRGVEKRKIAAAIGIDCIDPFAKLILCERPVHVGVDKDLIHIIERELRWHIVEVLCMLMHHRVAFGRKAKQFVSPLLVLHRKRFPSKGAIHLSNASHLRENRFRNAHPGLNARRNSNSAGSVAGNTSTRSLPPRKSQPPGSIGPSSLTAEIPVPKTGCDRSRRNEEQAGSIIANQKTPNDAYRIRQHRNTMATTSIHRGKPSVVEFRSCFVDEENSHASPSKWIPQCSHRIECMKIRLPHFGHRTRVSSLADSRCSSNFSIGGSFFISGLLCRVVYAGVLTTW